MNELNNKIERIFAEYVGKISLNPDTSNYIGKEDWENTQATLKELQSLVTEQVRLGRIDELERIMKGEKTVTQYADPNFEDLITYVFSAQEIKDRLAQLKDTVKEDV